MIQWQRSMALSVRSILSGDGGVVPPPMPQRVTGDGEMAQGWVDLPFDILNLRAENGPARRMCASAGRARWPPSITPCHPVPSRACFAATGDLDDETRGPGLPRQLDFETEGTTNANYGKSLDQYPVDTGRLRRVVEVAVERLAGRNVPGQVALGFAASSFLAMWPRVVDVEAEHQGRRDPAARGPGGGCRPRDSPGARAGAV